MPSAAAVAATAGAAAAATSPGAATAAATSPGAATASVGAATAVATDVAAAARATKLCSLAMGRQRPELHGRVPTGFPLQQRHARNHHNVRSVRRARRRD